MPAVSASISAHTPIEGERRQASQDLLLLLLQVQVRQQPLSLQRRVHPLQQFHLATDLRATALRPAPGALERRLDQREVGQDQVGRELTERCIGIGVRTERPQHQAERVGLPKRGQPLAGGPAGHVDEPDLSGDDLPGMLQIGQDGQARVRHGDHGLVGPPTHGARSCERREQGGLAGIRQADQADVLHARPAGDSPERSPSGSRAGRPRACATTAE